MTKQVISAESIARLADKKQDVSSYFRNDGKMMPAVESEETDPKEESIKELNETARQNRGTDSRL